MLDKLGVPNRHLCLSCQEPYTVYYNGKNEPAMVYTCHCGVERRFGSLKNQQPMTATELNERYRMLGGEIQAVMCEAIAPIINNMIEKLKKKGLIE